MLLLRQMNANIMCLLNTSHCLRQSVGKRCVHMSGVVLKEGDRRSQLKNLPKRDDGSQGERMELTAYERVCDFPTTETPNQLFDDIPFKDLPILHIKTTKNNTIFSLTHSNGQYVLTRTCGAEGFKTCRKGTNVAAQVTGLNMGQRIAHMGYKTVRVCIKGLGPGRMSSIKGLTMGGINIVSITDTTPITEIPMARPPAARSV